MLKCVVALVDLRANSHACIYAYRDNGRLIQEVRQMSARRHSQFYISVFELTALQTFNFKYTIFEIQKHSFCF